MLKKLPFPAPMVLSTWRMSLAVASCLVNDQLQRLTTSMNGLSLVRRNDEAWPVLGACAVFDDDASHPAEVRYSVDRNNIPSWTVVI